jgi:hypothetical protein
MSPVITKSRIRRGLANAIAVAILIVVAIMLSQAAEARPDNKTKRHKVRNHVIHNNSSRACYRLYKKRTHRPKKTFSLARRNKKPKPMAEAEWPANL